MAVGQASKVKMGLQAERAASGMTSETATA